MSSRHPHHVPVPVVVALAAVVPLAIVAAFIATLLATPAPASSAAPSSPDAGLAFRRTDEPRERAFSILVPHGWSMEGGIFRVNAAAVGGPLNALEAKCDLTFASDGARTVMFRIHPDIVYGHYGIGGGFWGPGSSYQGATVRVLETAEQHLQSIFQNEHPQATDVETLAIRRLPGEIEAMQRGMAYSNQLLAAIGLGGQMYQCDAAGAVFEYTEGGVRYHHVLATGIIDQRAAMTWKNTRTLGFRAPAAEFERWAPVMDVMRASIRFHLPWVLKEAKNQRDQAEFAMKVFDEMNKIDREIAARSSATRSEVMNENYLVLTGQEEYVDPETGEVELDTNAYDHRWKNADGDVFFTNDADADPNRWFEGTEFRRSGMRARR